MIRLLEESDKDQVLQYLKLDPSYNIFPIGDIEAFGFDAPFQRIYGEFNEDNDLCSVFLRYRNNAIYSCHEKRFNTDYLPIFDDDPFDFCSGKTELLDLIRPYLTGFSHKQMYFCEATTYNHAKPLSNVSIQTLSTKEDCERLYDLLSEVEEFGVHKQPIEDFIEGKMSSIQMGITLFIEMDDEIASTVAATAETTTNAMVVAVATRKKHRNKGYASQLMQELMYEYITIRNKSLCLFYDNPKAGAIYMRLGFVPIGTWDMYSKEG